MYRPQCTKKAVLEVAYMGDYVNCS